MIPKEGPTPVFKPSKGTKARDVSKLSLFYMLASFPRVNFSVVNGLMQPGRLPPILHRNWEAELREEQKALRLTDSTGSKDN